MFIFQQILKEIFDNSMSYFTKSTVVKELSPNDFEEIFVYRLKNHDCSIVLFYAPWCKFCKAVKDSYETFAKSATFIDVYAMDCEKHAVHVMSIKNDMPQLIVTYPTIVFYSKGEPMEQYMGDRTAEDLLKSSIRFCSN